MINATPNTTSSTTPQPMTENNANVPKANFTPQNKQSRKIFGVDARSIMTVVGLTAFFIVSMLGVIIALRQRQVDGPVAPHAPQSRPAAAEQTSANCSISFTVAGPTLVCGSTCDPDTDLCPTGTSCSTTAGVSTCKLHQCGADAT